MTTALLPTMASVSYKPIPKPRKSLNNQNFKTQNSNDLLHHDSNLILNSELRPFLLNKPITPQNTLEFQQLKISSPPLGIPPSCPVTFVPQLSTAEPPPLPPRNTSAQLPLPSSLNIASLLTKQQSISNLIIYNDTDELLDELDSVTLSSFHNEYCDIESSENVTSSLSSENSVNLARCSFASIADLTSNYCDSIIYTNGSNIEDLNNNNNKETIQNDCMYVGESICFSGWVRLIAFPQSCSYKKDFEKRYWAVIQSNKLLFTINDEVIKFIIV